MSDLPNLAEEELIKSVLYDSNECEWALANLEPKHFYNQRCREIYERIHQMLSNGKDVNLVTLTENYDKHKMYIFDLIGSAYMASNSKSQAEVILNSYFKREGEKQLLDTLKHVKSSDCTPDSLRTKVEELAYFLSFRSNSKTIRPLSDIAAETMKEFDNIIKDHSSNIKTGFKDLDAAGWSPRIGTFTIVAARPAMGKSAFALDLAEGCGKPVAFFSLEMQGIQQFERLLTRKLNVPNSVLRTKRYIEKNTPAILNAVSKINELKIYINDSPTISTLQLRMQIKRAISKYGIKMVIVDYMGYIDDNQQVENRRIEMGKYSRAMLNIAKDLQVAMVGLCQLNRECEARSDKRPILADLKETGDFEQDAELCLFLYRDSVYHEDKDPNVAEVICRKSRSGITGAVKVGWQGTQTKFTDFEEAKNNFGEKGWDERYK